MQRAATIAQERNSLARRLVEARRQVEVGNRAFDVCEATIDKGRELLQCVDGETLEQGAARVFSELQESESRTNLERLAREQAEERSRGLEKELAGVREELAMSRSRADYLDKVHTAGLHAGPKVVVSKERGADTCVVITVDIYGKILDSRRFQA